MSMKRRDEVALRYSRNVGRNVRRIRTERGVSASELARRTAATSHPIGRQSLGTTERGRHPNGQALKSVSVDELMALAHVLDVSPMVLLADPEGS
jgi:transcriptional regulator with XRE-family HTH domain